MVVSALAIWLVIAGHNSATGTQQFKFRPPGNEPLNRVEDVDNVPAVARHQSDPYDCAAVQVL